LKLSEYKGFQIQIHGSEDKSYADIYRNEKLPENNPGLTRLY